MTHADGAARLHIASDTAAPRLWCRRPGCSTPLAVPGRAGGRPPIFCSPTCRKLTHEQRRGAEVAYRNSLRALEQFGAAPRDSLGPQDVVDAAGALLLHARRAAAVLRAGADIDGVRRADALSSSADILEALLIDTM